MIHPEPVPWIAHLTPAIHGAVSRDGLIDFSANGNVLGPPPGAVEALRAVDLSQYPDREAHGLREAIALRGGVPFDGVVVGNGSTELIWTLARAYLAPGDRVLIAAPTYGEYEVASRAAGGQVFYSPPLPLEREPEEPIPEVDLESLSAAIQRESPKIVWVCHPNNPTGRPFPVGRLAELATKEPRCLFVVDEAYLTLATGLESAVPLIGGGQIVVLRSLTKDLGLAGVRLGYALAAPTIAEILRRASPPWSVSSLAQAAGVAALTDRGHLERVRTAVAASRAHLAEGLACLGLQPYPSVANFVLVSVSAAAPVAAALLAGRLVVRDCTSFGLPDCIRIGVRSIPDQEILLGALREVLPG